jgi:metal-responsive CopG/Arc/MetJ family transcriptional regulator
MFLKGVGHMPLSPGNTQISVVLPQVIVDMLDKEAKENFYTRSQQAARIIIDYLVEHHKKEDSK